MRATIDIPDDTFRKLKVKAAQEGVAYRKIVLRGIDHELATETKATRRFVVPIIPSRNPGSINPSQEQLDEAFHFS